MKSFFCLFLLGSSFQGLAQPSHEQADLIIRVSASLNCSVNSAFEYFSNNQLLEKWLAVKADVEMKEGGRYELFWSPDDPDPTNNSTYGCKVLALEKPYYFNLEWRGNKDHKGFMNNVRPLTNVTVILYPEDGGTKVTLLHTGWRQGQDWRGAYAFFTKAWTGAFQSLEKLVNDSSAERMADNQKWFCYYLRLSDKYKDPAAWNEQSNKIIEEHAQWLENLGQQGILLLAGRTLVEPGNENLFGVAFIKAKDLEEAKRILAPDPAVLAGIQNAMVLPYSMGIRYFANIKD